MEKSASAEIHKATTELDFLNVSLSNSIALYSLSDFLTLVLLDRNYSNFLAREKLSKKTEQRLLNKVEDPEMTADVRDANFEQWEENLGNAVAVAEEKLRSAQAGHDEVRKVLVALYSRVSDFLSY